MFLNGFTCARGNSSRVCNGILDVGAFLELETFLLCACLVVHTPRKVPINPYPKIVQRSRYNSPWGCGFSFCEPTAMGYGQFMIYVSFLLTVFTASFGALVVVLVGGGFVMGEVQSFFTIIVLMVTTAIGTRIAASSVDKGIISRDGRTVVNTAVRTVRRPSNARCKTVAGISNHCSVRNVHTNNPCGMRISCMNCRSIICGDVGLRLKRGCMLSTGLGRSARLLSRMIVATSGDDGVGSSHTKTIAGISTTEVSRIPAIDHDVGSVVHLAPRKTGVNDNFSINKNGCHRSCIAISKTTFGGTFNVNSGLPTNNSPVSLSTLRRVSISAAPFSIHRDKFAKNTVGTIAGDNAGRFGNATCVCASGARLANGGMRSCRLAHGHSRDAACKTSLKNTVVGGGLFFFIGNRCRSGIRTNPSNVTHDNTGSR